MLNRIKLGRTDMMPVNRSGAAPAAPCITAIKTYPVESDADGCLYLDVS